VNIILDIKKPEITKNISTAMNPPGIKFGKKWKPNKGSIPKDRRPSISDRYFWLIDIKSFLAAIDVLYLKILSTLEVKVFF